MNFLASFKGWCSLCLVKTVTLLGHTRLTGKPDTNWRQMGNAVYVKSGMKGDKITKKEKIKELNENELVKDNKRHIFIILKKKM